MSKSFRIFVVALCLVSVFEIALAERLNSRVRLFELVKSDTDVQEDIKAEVKLGRQIAANILGKYGLYGNDTINEYVSKVGHSLTLELGRREIDYYFSVLDTEEINAYAAPGGYIFITRGLLQQLQDESELAAVLAHEIIHVDKKHIVEALDIKGFADSHQRGFVTFIGGIAGSARVAFDQAVDSALEVLFSQGLHHEAEFESDKLALQILHHVGYEPGAIARVLHRMEDSSSEYTEVIRSTHPSFESRLSHITESELIAASKPGAYVRVKKRFSENTVGL
ncbi:MAG: M48 family metalloprotease [Gammaproteobacteria bacterium]|nr:M48 family metalloprotease [Gammaproteobacteria bacterium]